MSTLISIFAGGELSKKSWLYRFLSLWDEERAKSITDSCQLRAAILVAGLKTLVSTAVVLYFLWLIAVAIIERPVLSLAELGAAIAVMITIIALAAGIAAAGTRWKWAEIGFYVTVITVIAGLIGYFVLICGSAIGGELSPVAHRMAPTIFPEVNYYPELVSLETALGIGVIVGGIGAVVVLSLLCWQGWKAFRRFQSWAAKTNFWLWLKGKLCFPVEITD